MSVRAANHRVTIFMLLVVSMGFITSMILLLSASPIHFESPSQPEIKERAEIQAKWDEMIGAIHAEDEAKIEELSKWLDKHAGTSFEKLEDAKARLICAWCGADLGEANTSEDTHGICEPCKATYFPPRWRLD